jgi:hypothetical protein
MSRLGDWGMLYAILFAFTAAGHVYGDRGNQFKQLRTGRDVARMLGGYGTNGVGQATLGLWFARKLQGESSWGRKMMGLG